MTSPVNINKLNLALPSHIPLEDDMMERGSSGTLTSLSISPAHVETQLRRSNLSSEGVSLPALALPEVDKDADKTLSSQRVLSSTTQKMKDLQISLPESQSKSTMGEVVTKLSLPLAEIEAGNHFTFIWIVKFMY